MHHRYWVPPARVPQQRVRRQVAAHAQQRGARAGRHLRARGSRVRAVFHLHCCSRRTPRRQRGWDTAGRAGARQQRVDVRRGAPRDHLAHQLFRVGNGPLARGEEAAVARLLVAGHEQRVGQRPARGQVAARYGVGASKRRGQAQRGVTSAHPSSAASCRTHDSSSSAALCRRDSSGESPEAHTEANKMRVPRAGKAPPGARVHHRRDGAGEWGVSGRGSERVRRAPISPGGAHQPLSRRSRWRRSHVRWRHVKGAAPAAGERVHRCAWARMKEKRAKSVSSLNWFCFHELDSNNGSKIVTCGWRILFNMGPPRYRCAIVNGSAKSSRIKSQNQQVIKLQLSAVITSLPRRRMCMRLTGAQDPSHTATRPRAGTPPPPPGCPSLRLGQPAALPGRHVPRRCLLKVSTSIVKVIVGARLCGDVASASA